MAGARAGEQGTYTGARRASRRGEQWPHQGEKAELCRLLEGPQGWGTSGSFPSSGWPLPQASRPGQPPCPSPHWGHEWADTLSLASPVTKRG